MEDPFNIMEDFDIKAARVNISGSVAIVDNVKKVIIMSDTNITVDHGRGQVSLYGTVIQICSKTYPDNTGMYQGKPISQQFYPCLNLLSECIQHGKNSHHQKHRAVKIGKTDCQLCRLRCRHP